MNRFVSAQADRLVQKVIEVSIVANGGSMEPIISQIYPDTQIDESFKKTLALFVYPDPVSIESRSFFNFIVGDTACDYQHGFIQYYSSVKAVCIISDFYYPELYKALLQLPIDQICIEADRINSRSSNNDISLNKKRFRLDGEIQKQRSVELVFKTFNGYEISKIIIGMLHARLICPISLSVSRLTPFAAALPLLIDPFRWDLNTIPVLPLKIKEVVQIPVPTLIGVTQSAIVNEHGVGPNILINIDTKLISTIPRIDDETQFGTRVLATQIQFHEAVKSFMNNWSGAPGFPYKIAIKYTRRFIYEYLRIFTGDCSTPEEFKSKIPEPIRSSHVLNDLVSEGDSPSDIRQRIDTWLDEMITPKKRVVRVSQSIRNKLSDKGRSTLSLSTSTPVLSINSDDKQDSLFDLLSYDAPPMPSSPPLQNSKRSASTQDDLFDDLLGFSPSPSQASKSPPKKNDGDLMQFFDNGDLLF